jgi:predicted TIM-barrel fold metal-dependent hydrolase
LAPSGSAPVQSAPRKIDRAAAYYHYTLAHYYEEMVTAYGRGDLANPAIQEYRLAIEADPSSEFLTAGLAELYVKTGRIRDAVLEAHAAAGGGRFRGIRHITAWDDSIIPTTSVVPPPGLMHDPAFLRGVQRLGELGMSYDAWLYHPQLKDLLAVARAAPGTQIVIDHVGGPLGGGPFRGKRDEVFKAWAADMKNLAACPNVHVKLGGLAMPVNGFDYHNDELPPSSARMAEDWTPWFRTCIELFGAGRCMFESNFPVDKGMCSYPVLWNAFKRIAAGASAQEKAALFHDTAARFYRLSGV